MATIEEMAEKYSAKQTYFVGDPNKYNLVKYIYKDAATEQHDFDIEKACEWLTKHAEDFTEPQSDWIHVDKLVEDFRKFMKGE